MTSSVALGLALSLASSLAFAQADAGAGDGRRWLAGDHHVHSRFSARYTPDPASPESPPLPQLGGDGNHTIVQNAEAAHRYGLSWMVSTDHGGPLHARLNAEQAWPELLQARERVPGLVLFYGMEFDTPGAEHSSLIIAPSAHEREDLLHIEGTWGRRQPWPEDPARDTEAFMLEALRDMAAMSPRPVMVTNHPSRSATGLGQYGEVRPHQLRDWSEVIPRVVIGMEGAPGHQADGLFADGRPDPAGSRGIYRRFPTMGGFDQMTARLAGVWDSLLGEGRRWWITATSDSHTHLSEGGDDFWPGEYAKTWVMARPDGEDILDGLREGRVFVTTGDLISELDVTVSADDRTATIGGELVVGEADDIVVTLRVRDPRAANAAGRTPSVDHIDLIVGDVTGGRADRDADANATTRVERRFTAADWTSEGEVLTMTHRLPASEAPRYLRVRGTSGVETEPMVDTPGEDPWSDLWFYGNPVFLTGSTGAR
ncbi:phosphoesterase [Brevundimonas sp.]|uniref:phosphoesterase n=1 Tax=Brevundimonas sp. TaxID=1871086 RepID=UPI002602F0A6|nr:phosphoesterase [Brevundimonas sp.]